MPFGIIQTKGGADAFPGTEVLIGEARHDGQLSTETDALKRVRYKGVDTILVPQPCDNDPNDPLLWPRWKKETTFWVIFVNTIIFGILPGPILAPSTFALAQILGVSLTKIAELSGYQLLVVGALGPLVSVLAQKYGKRVQFLFAAVMGTVGTIICIAGSQNYNYNTLLAGRMIQGLGVTAWESLSLAAVGDMFYLHERGWRTALLVATLACSASLVSIISGVMTQNVGWRYLFIACIPFNAVGLLATVFLLPETQFRRPLLAAASSTSQASETEKPNSSTNEVHSTNDHGAEQRHIENVPRKSYVQTLAPTSGTYSERNIFHLLSEIFMHLANPAVIWILLVSGVMVSLFVVSAYITSQIWSVPPYNLNAAQNGYFYVGGLLGGILAIPIGDVCDWTARVFARLNHGVFESEFRIPINFLAVIFTALGWFLFMWDVNHPRPNGYYLGAFCHGAVCFGISVSSTSAGLYILDSFPKQKTEVFILQMMLKNFMFYGFSHFINKWAAEDGPGEVFKVFGIVSVALLTTCIPMYIFGKLNRQAMHKLHTRSRLFKTLG